MKKFLSDLKKELVRLKFKPDEIEEILDDHKEMIETAQNEGISDEEIVLKFGDPIKLAKEIKENTSESTIKISLGGENMKDYELFQSFSVSEKEFDVSIHLVSEDVIYELHDVEEIQVYYKEVKNIEDYEITFDGKTFVLKHKNKLRVLSWSKNSGHFLVKVPVGIQSKTFSIQNVSGDSELQGISTKELSIKTTSGDAEVNEFKASSLSFSTVSGDVEIQNGKIETMTLSTVSGDVEMDNIDCSGTVDINTVSGDVEVENSFFGPTNFKSVSGDLIGKEFYPTSVQLKSVSGDIEIKNEDKERKINILKSRSVRGDVNIS